MTLKRFLSVIAAASLALSFTACDDDNDKKDNSTQEQPGDNPGQQPGDNPGQQPGDNPGQQPGDNPGQQPGDNPDEAAAKALNEAEPLLQSCDFKSASEKFEIAYNANKADASIAFQRSILGVLNLVNNDNIQSVLKDLGFTGSPIDLSVIWKDDGIFKQMVSGAPDFRSIFDKLPHPAIIKDLDIDDCFDGIIDSLKDSFTTATVLKALNNMDNDLLSLAESFETAAKGLEGNKLIAIDKAGCSLNEIKFGSADLYAFAALIRASMAFVDWASAYDFDISTKQYYRFDSDILSGDYKTKAEAQKACTTYKTKAKFITDHLFQVKSADAGKDGRKHLAAAAVDIKAAAEAAPKMDKNAFFGWSALKSGALQDVKTIAQSLIDSEDGSKPIAISQISPVLNIDLTKLFDKAIPTSRKLEGMCEIWESCKEYNEDYSACKTADYYYLNTYNVDGGLLDAFFGEDILNTIAGAKVYSYALDTDCQKMYQKESLQSAETIKLLCSYGDFSPEYSHSFSSAWKDIDFEEFVNPHGYLGAKEDDSASH